MVEPKYQIGDTIPGTQPYRAVRRQGGWQSGALRGTVVSKTFSHDNRWVYCIEFNRNLLTISEENIDTSLVEALTNDGKQN